MSRSPGGEVLSKGVGQVPLTGGKAKDRWPAPPLPRPLTGWALCVHRWSHEYQEATIEKIIRFLQGRSSRDSSAGSDTSLEGAAPMGPV